MKKFLRDNTLRSGRALSFILVGASIAWAVSLGALHNLLSEKFLPHGFCFLWNPRLLTLHVVSDGIIFVAYLWISFTLGSLVWRERRNMPFAWMFLAFGTFIVACGFTHLMEILVLWHPFYWLAGDIKLLTAVLSLTTAAMLPGQVPKFRGLMEASRTSRCNEQRFLAASENSKDAFYILESVRDEAGDIVDFRLVLANRQGAELISSAVEDLPGKLLCRDYPFTVADGYFDVYKRVVETGERLERESAIDVPAVRATWLAYQVVKLGDGIALTIRDITQRKENELKLAVHAKFTESIIASSPFTTIVTDLDGTITAMNPAAEKMSGYAAEELLDRQTPLLMLESADLARRSFQLSETLGTVIEAGMGVLKVKPLRGEVEEAEWKLVRKDGSRLDVQLTVSGLTDPVGSVVGLILIAYDITERKRAEDCIAHLAHHDALTGLPARTMFHNRLKQALDRAARNIQKAGQKVGILLLDLDHFKQVNDRLGHQAGDELLVEVARRLKSVLRTSDTVARLGGDEFVVLLDELHSAYDGERIAEKLLVALRVPIEIGGETLTPLASIGLCVYPENGETDYALLKHADEAMYQAKQGGGNSYRTFTDDLASASLRKRQLEVNLLDAVEHGEFELVYQPQVSLSTGMVGGVEALLRWRSRGLGPVAPSEFIPVAEETGAIIPIGEWVLRTACRQGRQLQVLLGRDLSVAVNVSVRQFHQDRLPGLVAELLAESGLVATSLELEITEHMLVSEVAKPLAVLDAVRALGVRVAIDDFGTGFSSMSYIMRSRVDRLKIDRSFIQTMATDANSSAIATAVIALARGLRIPVIAEGVETAAQRDLLLSQGCNEAQGYYFAKPVGIGELVAVILALEADAPAKPGAGRLA